MTTIKGPLDEHATKVTGEALQDTLVDVLDLSLVAKQAHWNLVGKRFRSIHLQLDEVVNTARQYADLVAERCAAIGVNPDGRVATVAKDTALPKLADGWLRDDDVIPYFVDAYAGIIARMRQRVAETDRTDQVTQDLLLSLTAELEKQAWMLQAEQ